MLCVMHPRNDPHRHTYTLTQAVIERKKSLGRMYDCQLYGVLTKKVEKRGRPTRFVKRCDLQYFYYIHLRHFQPVRSQGELSHVFPCDGHG